MAGRPAQGTTQKVSFVTTTEQADALAAQPNKSEFIRSAVAEKLATGAKTTHRASFPFGNNGYIIETEEGGLSLDGIRPVTSALYGSALYQHQKTGFHGDCVICQDNQKRAFATGRIVGGEIEITPADQAATEAAREDAFYSEIGDNRREAKYKGA